MNTRKHVEEAGTPGHGIAQKNQGPTVGFFNEPLGEDKKVGGNVRFSSKTDLSCCQKAFPAEGVKLVRVAVQARYCCHVEFVRGVIFSQPIRQAGCPTSWEGKNMGGINGG